MDRLPHNPDAEAALVARLYTNPADIAAVSAEVRPEDFYLPDVRGVYAAMVALSAERRAVDLVTLSEHGVDEVAVNNLIDSAGPAFRAPVEEYVGIVRRDAQRRRIIASLERVIRAAYEQDEVENVLAELADASSDIAAGSEAGRLISPAQAADAYHLTLDRRLSGGVAGLEWGLAELDRLMQPAAGGEMIVLAARPGVGKALPDDAPVLTPRGFVPMGTLRVGDTVIGSRGQQTTVEGVYPQGEMDVYSVEMSDGASVEATADHLWLTQTRTERRRGSAGSVKTTQDIARTITRTARESAPNHLVPLVSPVEYESREEPELDPYVMGLLLGDGGMTKPSVRFTSQDADLVDSLLAGLPRGDTLVRVNEIDWRVKRVRRDNGRSELTYILDEYGLIGKSSVTKFIPDDYLYGSPQTRLAVLQGLLDTDGHVTGGGVSVEYTTRSPRLADGVLSLVRSLGGLASHVEFTTAVGHTYWRMNVRLPNGVSPVRCVRKVAALRERTDPRRSIVNVLPAGRKSCRCIRVASPDGLFVTKDFIVTHNTTLAETIAESWARTGPVMFASLEMSVPQLLDRSIARNGGIPSPDIIRGRLTADQERIARDVASARRDVNIWYLDDPFATTATLRAAAARVRILSGGLVGVVVDYLQLLKDGSGNESEVQRVTRISRQIKALAREYDVPVLCLSQLSRAVESRDDKHPKLYDLRESGAIEQDADRVLGLYRVAGESKMDCELLKNRQGPVGMKSLYLDTEYCRFGNDPITDAYVQSRMGEVA